MNDLQKTPKKQRIKRKTRVTRVRHGKESKVSALKYYLMGLTLPEISILLSGVPIRTIEKWQLSGKWTSLKNATNLVVRVLQLHESGKTVKDIAAMVDRNESTVYRWLNIAKKAAESE